MDTGFTLQDAQSDFARLRRERVLHRLASRLRGERGDVDVILPFDEVVDALGRVGERHLGLKQIPLDAIVGTLGRSHDFDRSFRPISQTTRPRCSWPVSLASPSSSRSSASLAPAARARVVAAAGSSTPKSRARSSALRPDTRPANSFTAAR